MSADAERLRCASSTGVDPSSFTDQDVVLWGRFGEPQIPPSHDWYSPPLMASQLVCRRCGDTLKHGRTYAGTPFTNRWCWSFERPESMPR